MWRIRRYRSCVQTLGKTLLAGWTEPIRRGRRKPSGLCNDLVHSRDLGGGAGDRLLMDVARVLEGVSPVIDQSRVAHSGKIRGCTQRCLRTLVPKVGWWTRDRRGGIQHKVLVQIAVPVAGIRIRIRSQRLLGRGRGKPCLLLVIRGERRDVERGNVESGKKPGKGRL